MFLALNLIPLLTKYGNSNAESADVTVEIDPVLSLRLSKDEIKLNPSPIPEGTFVYDTLSAIVDTNNRTGYTLTMNSETEEAALVQEDGVTKIDPLANEVTVTSENQSNFTMNHWGYSLTSALTENNTTFNPTPALSTPDTIKTSDAPIVNDITPVSFATRVNTSLPSGTYKNTVVFTAVANEIPSKTFNGIMFMQDMTADICAKETTPTKDATKTTQYRTSDTNLVPEAILTDSRDGEQYIVRKLADGNCWMSQNLRLQLSTSKSLTPADSDVLVDWTPTYDTQTTTGVVWEEYQPRSYINIDNKENGGYYTWFAATAGQNSDTAYNGAVTSICPKGWTIPNDSGIANREIGLLGLISKYSKINNLDGTGEHSGAAVQAPLSFILSGSYFGDGQFDDTLIARLWTSFPRDNRDSRYAEITSTGYSVGNGWSPNSGFSVRCIARDGKPRENSTILNQALSNANTEYKMVSYERRQTMQGMTNAVCNAVPTPSKEEINVPQATLVDSRDNNLYTVKKLADGNCWMTQNLRLVGSRTLTSADSDVSSNWTLPADSTSGFSDNTAANVGPVNSSYGNGAYYTWCAATAGTCSSATVQNQEAPSSICPKGWRLPYSGTYQTGSKSFKYLMDTYGYSNGGQLTEQPLQFAYGGNYSGRSLYGGGSAGNYWSSTAYSSTDAYNLLFNSSYVDPQDYGRNRYRGFSVRCVLR